MARRSACRWGRRRSAPGSHGLWQAIRPLLPAPATPLRRPTRIDCASDDRTGRARDLPETALRATSRHPTTQLSAVPFIRAIARSRGVLRGNVNPPRIHGKDALTSPRRLASHAPAGADPEPGAWVAPSQPNQRCARVLPAHLHHRPRAAPQLLRHAMRELATRCGVWRLVETWTRGGAGSHCRGHLGATLGSEEAGRAGAARRPPSVKKACRSSSPRALASSWRQPSTALTMSVAAKPARPLRRRPRPPGRPADHQALTEAEPTYTATARPAGQRDFGGMCVQ
jgi:hypothetical protein